MEPQQRYPQTPRREYCSPPKSHMVDFGNCAGYPSRGVFAAGSFFFLFASGLFVISMLVVVPIWNSIALLRDATFVYLSGPALPSLLIAVCLGVVFFYAVTIFVFCQSSRPEVQTEQTILMIASVFLALLGVLLLLLATPLERSADNGYHSIWNNCQFDGRTRALYDESQALQMLRANPSCADMQSVEECTGYQRTPTAMVLKAMESHFKCSGFCFQPFSVVAGTNSTTQTSEATAGGAAGGSNEVGSEQEHDSTRAELLLQYPPTLFGLANFQASCDGMAARNMRNFAGDVAVQTFYEGIMLVLVSIVIGFLKLIGFCAPHRRREEEQLLCPKQGMRVDQGYGAVPAVRQRHVGQGEFSFQ